MEGLEEGRKEGLEKGRIEGLEKGRIEGLEEGRKKALIDNAKKMKSLGSDLAFICSVTGLSEAEVSAL